MDNAAAATPYYAPVSPRIVPFVKVAVVTPYYKEDDAVLRRAHDSVLGQTYECHHVVVADGHPKSMFDDQPRTLHVRLPMGNGDCGNTPRAIGGILAEAYGFDAVAYLDADNWYEPDHIEKLVAAQKKTDAALVSCKRKFFDLAGNPLDVIEKDEDAKRHVDSSCWLLFRPAFPLLRAWLMPKVLGDIGDRIFLRIALHNGYRILTTNYRTVAYRTPYAAHYVTAGLPPPPNAKTEKDLAPINAYCASEEGAAELKKLIGPFFPLR